MSFTIDLSGMKEMPNSWKHLKDVEIKDSYPHEHSLSIFVMMDMRLQLHWSPSGNELRRIYLEDPDRWVSGPTELPITEGLDKIFEDLWDNF